MIIEGWCGTGGIGRDTKKLKPSPYIGGGICREAGEREPLCEIPGVEIQSSAIRGLGIGKHEGLKGDCE